MYGNGCCCWNYGLFRSFASRGALRGSADGPQGKMQEEQSQCPKPPRKTWQRSVPTKKCEMIALYCRKQHHTLRGSLCPECQQLHDYALARIEHCPFMETKTFCSACKVHCYQPEMREKIRTVMRWAGPRMLPVHPVLSIKHVVVTMKARREANAGK